jgi:AraC-like DNA-binding protein
MALVSDTRGILNPYDGLKRFSLERPPPPESLRPWVDRFWIVSWHLAAGERHEQEVLPHPSVQLAFEAHGATVHGIGTRRFVARLEGWGRVIGVKLLPGAFTAFSARPAADLIDRVLPLADVFGERADALAQRVSGERDTERAVGLIGTFLESLAPAVDENIARVVELVSLVQRDRSITRSEALARHAGLNVRSLQRLFERYLGLGPKWVIARARVQEAAERIATGQSVDFAALAVELGYHDRRT